MSRFMLVGLCLCASFSGAVCPGSMAWAANRFVIQNQSFLVGSTANNVTILADLDQDIHGFSVHLQYDAAKVRVTAVEPGAAVSALEPEFADGTITNSPGRLVYGMVFDLSDPVTKKLSPGTAKEVLKLTVDVVAVSQTTVLLDLVNVPGPPSRLNVMTSSIGDSVSPAPSLVDGTLTLSDLKPNIQSYSGNSGGPGKEFLVVGQNFNQPGLAVMVCGKEAAFTLLGDNQTLRVVAPACSSGPAEVEVCTDRGCDSDPAGFTYDAGPSAPVIDAIHFNSGRAGTVFVIIGRNFTVPGLAVEVCGVSADFSLLVDNQTLEVTAPACGSAGFALAEVCTSGGCASQAEGFFYEEAGGTTFVRGNTNNDLRIDLSDAVAILNFLFLGIPAAAPCRDALDCNDDGKIDLSDPIFELAFLFQGGAPIPAPYPDAGLDPTPDSLPDC